MSRPNDEPQFQRRQEFPFSDYGERLYERTAMAASDAVARSSDDVTLQHLPDEHLYAAWVNSAHVGHLHYRVVPRRIILLSTEVAPAYRHRGIATELIRATLDDVRTTDKRITIICPVVRAFINQHPHYEDMIDPILPGVLRDDPRVETNDAE
jgi:predicted GNAT family acetyltransferase